MLDGFKFVIWFQKSIFLLNTYWYNLRVMNSTLRVTYSNVKWAVLSIRIAYDVLVPPTYCTVFFVLNEAMSYWTACAVSSLVVAQWWHYSSIRVLLYTYVVYSCSLITRICWFCPMPNLQWHSTEVTKIWVQVQVQVISYFFRAAEFRTQMHTLSTVHISSVQCTQYYEYCE